MERKNTLLLTVIAVATLLVAVVGATFAYFTANATNEGTGKVTVQTESRTTTSTTGSDTSLSILASDMKLAEGKDDYSKYKDSATPATVVYTVTASADSAQSCAYEVVYNALVGENGGKTYAAFAKSVANTTPLKEYTVLLTKDTTGAGVTDSSTPSEVDLTTVGTTETTLVTGTLSVPKGISAVLTFNVTPRFYNLALSQDDNSGKTFGGTVSWKSALCTAVAA